MKQMKKFIEEFKAFALKGNMINLAVGMIIGSAFTSIVNSLVNDIFMPILEYFYGKDRFSTCLSLWMEINTPLWKRQRK